MAGDWIKVEVTLPDKTEVVQMASKLKLDQDAICGKLVRIWAWADQNEINGNAIPITVDFIDRATYCPGFSEALKEVGWLEEQNGSLTFPRFDRHNGQVAKKRAETKRRVANSRSAKKSVEAKVETVAAPSDVAGIHHAIVAELKPSEPDVPVNKPSDYFAPNAFSITPGITNITIDGVEVEFHEDGLRWVAEFLRQWNSLIGVTKRNYLDETMKKHLAARLLNPHWDWKRAFSMFPLRNETDWTPNMTWFLRDGTVSSILDGTFKSAGKQGRASSRKQPVDVHAGIKEVLEEERAKREKQMSEFDGVFNSCGNDGLSVSETDAW